MLHHQKFLPRMTSDYSFSCAKPFQLAINHLDVLFCPGHIYPFLSICLLRQKTVEIQIQGNYHCIPFITLSKKEAILTRQDTFLQNPFLGSLFPFLGVQKHPFHNMLQKLAETEVRVHILLSTLLNTRYLSTSNPFLNRHFLSTLNLQW